MTHLGARWRRRWRAAAFGAAVMAAPAHAADSMLVEISTNARTRTISVVVGKTQSLRTSTNFADVIVARRLPT